MATYAAYRHVELDNVGYGKKRVLKPPGGGSSDIFGASESTSPRRAKQSQASSLGSGFFGKSGGSTPASTPSSNGSAPETPRANSTMMMGTSGRDKPDGNPVTGAGYEAVVPSCPLPNGTSNGTSSAASSSAGSEKSSTDSSPSVQPVQRLKNRVPPGGFSSGLW